MPKFRIFCVWTVCGHYDIKAKDLDQAIDKTSDLPLPPNGTYVEGSFEIDRNESREIEEKKKSKKS